MSDEIFDAEFVPREPEAPITFKFNIDHQGVNLEVGAWSFSLLVKVVWDALTRGLNVFRSIWNGFLDILAGRPVQAFSF